MKFVGEIGFWEKDVETTPGVWKPEIVERHYTGDMLRNINRFQSTTESQNETFTISNKVSIIADLYAREHYQSIKYVIQNGTKWKVSSVEVAYPRLVLEIGGVYNGPNKVESASETV